MAANPCSTRFYYYLFSFNLIFAVEWNYRRCVSLLVLFSLDANDVVWVCEMRALSSVPTKFSLTVRCHRIYWRPTVFLTLSFRLLLFISDCSILGSGAHGAERTWRENCVRWQRAVLVLASALDSASASSSSTILLISVLLFQYQACGGLVRRIFLLHTSRSLCRARICASSAHLK